MRVLAIDTALAACAAAVLDTDHGIVASETLPVVRGHAESLIPLTARLADKDSQNTLTPAETLPPRGGVRRRGRMHYTRCDVASLARSSKPHRPAEISTCAALLSI
jgi:hypothetical protein